MNYFPSRRYNSCCLVLAGHSYICRFCLYREEKYEKILYTLYKQREVFCGAFQNVTLILVATVNAQESKWQQSLFRGGLQYANEPIRIHASSHMTSERNTIIVLAYSVVLVKLFQQYGVVLLGSSAICRLTSPLVVPYCNNHVITTMYSIYNQYRANVTHNNQIQYGQKCFGLPSLGSSFEDHPEFNVQLDSPLVAMVKY